MSSSLQVGGVPAAAAAVAAVFQQTVAAISLHIGDKERTLHYGSTNEFGGPADAYESPFCQ